jgi:beta-galactosidase
MGVARHWADWEIRTFPSAAEHHTTSTVLLDGSVVFDEEIVVPAAWDDLPRVGVTFTMPIENSHLRWFGRGPLESYPDRKASQRLGLWTSSVADQYHPYVRPQEHGCHVDCRWFELLDGHGHGIRVSGDVMFSARRHSDEELTNAETLSGLHGGEVIEVHVDAIMRGLGTGACGPDTAPMYRSGSGPFRWRWTLSER